MVKVGIIGAGRIGRVHITSISTRVKDAVIKTVADPFLNDETAAWAKSMGVEHTTKDYKEIINDPEINAVLIWRIDRYAFSHLSGSNQSRKACFL